MSACVSHSKIVNPQSYGKVKGHLSNPMCRIGYLIFLQKQNALNQLSK